MRFSRLALTIVLVTAACGRAPAADTSSLATPPLTTPVASSITTTAPTPPVSTAPSPSTTTTSTFSLVSTSSTTTVDVREPDHELALLISHRDGIDLWTPHQLSPVLRGREVEIAIPDRAGGVIFSSWDEGLAGPVEWIPDLGSESRVLVEDPDAMLMRPIQVALIEGRRTLVYRKWATLPNDCPTDDEECRWDYDREYLMLRDLDSGTDTTLGIIGSFESDYLAVGLGGDYAAITYNPYGSDNHYGTVVPLDALLRDASPERWIGRGLPGLFAGVEFTEDCCTEAVRVVLAPDGTTYLEVIGGTWFEPILGIRIVDTATDDEISFTEIADPGIHPYWIDFDGTNAVVGQWDAAQFLLIEPGGTITRLEGRSTIWSGGHG